MQFSNWSKYIEEDGHGNHRKLDATWRDEVTRGQYYERFKHVSMLNSVFRTEISK